MQGQGDRIPFAQGVGGVGCIVQGKSILAGVLARGGQGQGAVICFNGEGITGFRHICYRDSRAVRRFAKFGTDTFSMASYHPNLIAIAVRKAKGQLVAVVRVNGGDCARNGKPSLSGCGAGSGDGIPFIIADYAIVVIAMLPIRTIVLDRAVLHARNVRRIVAACDHHIDGLGYGVAFAVTDGENNAVGLLFAFGKAVCRAVGILFEGVGIFKGDIAAAAPGRDNKRTVVALHSRGASGADRYNLAAHAHGGGQAVAIRVGHRK